MSRLLKKVENEAAILKKDLKVLQCANMMADPDFHHMYASAVEHHRHLKLSHLSGKSEDIIRKLVTDTYMYGVLIKMLLEVEARSGDDDQDSTFEQVKEWYKANSHKLTSRPKFSAKRELPTPHLINISIPTSREPKRTAPKKKILFPSQKSAGSSRRSNTAPAAETVVEAAPSEVVKTAEQAEVKNSSMSNISSVSDAKDLPRSSRSVEEASGTLTPKTKDSGETPLTTGEPDDVETNDEEVSAATTTREEANDTVTTNEETIDRDTPGLLEEAESTINNLQSSSFVSQASTAVNSAQEMTTISPPNTPANDPDERKEDLKKEDNRRRPKAESTEEKSKSIYPISSIVTPFHSESLTRDALLKGNSSPARHSARFQTTPSLQTLQLVLQQHSHGAQYQLWREEDELTLRERRIQGEIVLPNSSEWQEQFRTKYVDMNGLRQTKTERKEKIEPDFVEYDTETFLRLTEGYYPVTTEKPSRLTSARSTIRQDDVFIKEAIQALSDVSTDMMANQRKEMTNVRWDERIEPIRLISHLACPPSRESHYYGPNSSNLLLLDENVEPETNRSFLLENAADWRGKISPSPHSGCRPKAPFSRHTFVKRLLRQRNRVQSQRFRPLSAPAQPPDSTTPVQCPPSFPETGRCTPPNLKSGAVEEAVKVQHIGGSGEDPWEVWMRRMRMRRRPIRKGPLQVEPQASTEYLSLITPVTVLGVFGVVDNLSSDEATQNPQGDSGITASHLAQPSSSSLGESQFHIPVPDTTPNTLSYADMEQLIRTHSARPKSASNQPPNKKSPVTARLMSNMTRTAPSIPSGREYGTLNDLAATASADSLSQIKYRLPKYTAVHPHATKVTSRPNSSKRDHKEALSVVGMNVNKSDILASSAGLPRENYSFSSRSGTPIATREYSQPPTPSGSPFPRENSPQLNDNVSFASNPRPSTPSKLQRNANASKTSLASNRPIPHYYEVNDPEQESRKVTLMKEAASSVDITKIFHANVPKNYLLRLSKEQRERLEDERKAAVVIQRCYRRHLNRCKTISAKSRDGEMKKWLKKYRRAQEEGEMVRNQRIDESRRQISAIGKLEAQKLSMIGPHIDIYEYFHPPRDGPTKRQKHIAAVIIQKWVRGWLTRVFMDRLKRKSLYHADSFKTFLNDYFSQMIRIQRRNGVRSPHVRFNLREMESYMDSKRKYELAFDSKAFRGRLLEKDIMKFFDECELSPAKYEIREALDVLHKNKTDHLTKGLVKADALELVFQIYKPKGTDLHDSRKSTWMHPLLNGVDAIRLVDSEELEPTPLSVCLKLVLESRQDQLSWEQKQRMKAQIKSLEENEAHSESEKVLRDKVKHELDKRKSHQRTAIPWIND